MSSSQGSRRSTRSSSRLQNKEGSDGKEENPPSQRSSESTRRSTRNSDGETRNVDRPASQGSRSNTSKRSSRSNGSEGGERTLHSSESTIRPQSTRKTSAKASQNGSVHSSEDTVPPQRRTTEIEQSVASSRLGSSNSDRLRTSNIGLLSDPINLSSPLHYGSSEGGRTGSRSTAYKKRVDIASDSRVVRQINVGENEVATEGGDGHVGTSESHSSAMPQLVIWGTDVSINNCKEKFKRFLKFPDFQNYEEDEMRQAQMDIDGQTSDKPLYMQKLEEIYTLEDPFLNLNCRHLQQFDPSLYEKLVSYPQEVIPAFDMATNEVFFDQYPDAQLPHQINVRPFNLVKTLSLRTLNPVDINQLITISGMVIRCSNIIAEMREAFFECSICRYTTTVEVDRGRIAEPTLCRNCNTSFSFRLIHNKSQFVDKQQIKLQEAPEDMPPSQTPYTALLYACADLVDTVQPGDRVTVTGIYRATPVRVNPRMRNVKSIYRTHVDVVHFSKIDIKRLHDDSKECHFTEERIDKLKALSRLPDIYERLARALAPSIYEHEDIKKGILLQLFGGTRKDYSLVDNSKTLGFRSEINILLCGDPGTSKSQLLSYVYKLVPRGQYTSGKGSSAVGLTASIIKDPDTRQTVLQTGALVLCDGGLCCIDEFDKMSDSTRSVLHEVMEQQTLSIAKAGIVCQLNARTSLLAAANPVESQWNKNKTIIENIQLPHTLLSR